MEEPNLRLKKLMLGVVDNQVRDNNPPETRKALERLMANGDTRQNAKLKIARVVIGEIYEILKNGKAFDLQAYTRKLSKLK